MNEDIITTQSIGIGIVETTPVLLEETPTTRLYFMPQIHQNGIRGYLIKYKKNKDSEWDKMTPEDFRKIKINEGIKVELPTEAIKKLYEAIHCRKEILEKDGVKYGEKDYIVADKNKVLLVNENNKKLAINGLLENNYTEDFWNTLISMSPEKAKNLSFKYLKSEREDSLKKYTENISKNNTEEFWQQYFEDNKWIFGYGLNYKILKEEQTQPSYGAVKIDRTGMQKGDFLMSTDGDISFTVLVEIKKPDTPLLSGTKPQRNGAWSLSKELTDAVTQLQANINTWETDGSKTENTRDVLESKNVYTTSPKGIIIIGQLSSLDDRDKRNTFERFRQNLHRIEIITYDELLKRAEFILK